MRIQVLNEILRAIELKNHMLQGHLSRVAITEFAEANGWLWSKSSTGFVVSAVHREDEIFYGRRMRGERSHAFFDHSLLFHEPQRPYRPIALVGQPYQFPKGSIAFRGKLGTRDICDLEWRVAPAALASIHFPGSCYFCVVTRSNTLVQWLPEQLDITRWGERAGKSFTH
jgi:hypothetical protein